MSTNSEEANELVQRKADEIAELTWHELDAYGTRTDYVTTPSGQRLHVVTAAYWDMEEWASGVNVEVKAYADRGWRRYWPYKGWAERGGPDDPVPPGPTDHRG